MKPTHHRIQQVWANIPMLLPQKIGRSTIPSQEESSKTRVSEALAGIEDGSLQIWSSPNLTQRIK
jgi:hypothetical protein